ncbi:unnamed protein product [Phytophthora lilii]|uniref:Unnamed protein product n=1 Tax=Phytophthora lilii TaxID=2077276 RepID=A0A9W6UAG4_9STRA|nr:unnamed protein product [Phytophthora lilii]
MPLQLVEDDQVLEAALSHLDDCNGGDAVNKQSAMAVKTTARRPKRTRNYNPNRAREAQRKELLAFRDQVPQLEQRLKMLQEEVNNSNPEAMAVGRTETMELWRKMAIYQRQTRLSAEEENKRLRELGIQHLLQFKQGPVESSGLVRDDTIVESFGEEHRFGKVLFDFKVKQIVRRYVVPGRVVIAWRAILSPDKFKGESLSGIQFEEKGALVVEPCQPTGSSDSASVVHTWQMITPDITDSARNDRKKLVQDMTEYVLHGCRPERAIESMERTSRAQLCSAHLKIW